MSSHFCNLDFFFMVQSIFTLLRSSYYLLSGLNSNKKVKSLLLLHHTEPFSCTQKGLEDNKL